MCFCYSPGEGDLRGPEPPTPPGVTPDPLLKTPAPRERLGEVIFPPAASTRRPGRLHLSRLRSITRSIDLLPGRRSSGDTSPISGGSVPSKCPGE